MNFLGSGNLQTACLAYAAGAVTVIWVLFRTEGYLMALCNWGTRESSTIDAVGANVALVICTLIVYLVLSGLLPANWSQIRLGQGPYDLFQGLVPTLLIFWAWSVLCKGIWLTLMRRHPPLQTWRTVLTTNTAIFAVGGVILAVLARPRLF